MGRRAEKRGGSLIPFLSRHAQEGLTAIGLHADGVSLARVSHAGGRPRLVACEYRPWAGEAEQKVLARLASDHGLKRAQCATCLDEADYKLLLTEAPDVRPEELKPAIRWRVKDLIDFHINDATLDVFDLPGAEARGRARTMYAVVARNQAIQRRVDMLDAAGINLQVIDIPELAQRNLAALTPEDARGVVFVSLTARGGLITVTKQGALFLSRTLDIGSEHLRDEAIAAGALERVVLEIQRSLDYYESHFREAPIAQLYLAPGADVAGLQDYLKANLNLGVRVFDVAEALDWRGDAATAERCLTSLGAALRQEVKAL